MNGFVDNELRALIEVPVSSTRRTAKSPLRVWVDTAFNGGLVIPRDQIARLGLKQASSTDAVLADGQVVKLETFSCYLDWFGKEFRASRRQRRPVSIARNHAAERSYADDRLQAEGADLGLIAGG